MTREGERVGGGKVVNHPQVSHFIESGGTVSAPEGGGRGLAGRTNKQTNITNIQSKNTDAGKLACGKSKLYNTNVR